MTQRSKRVLMGISLAAVAALSGWVFWGDWLTASGRPLLHGILGWGRAAPQQSALLERVHPPSGFSLSRFAEGLDNVRFLRFTPAGDLLASVPRDGKVLLLERPRPGETRAAGVRTLMSGLNRPHGMDLHEGYLYVAETDAVGRIRFDPGGRTTSGELERVVQGIPGGGNHWTRTLRFGPDGWMYVSIGSDCNVCIEEDPRRAAIVRYRPDGSGEEIYASGLRNAVGFDWRPATGELYSTENGRDLLGDAFPPCELDRIEKGGFYGWPYASGDRVPDPDFGKGNEARVAASIPPAHAFRAHNAPLGLTFLRGEKLPPEYRGAAVVALHGSWNRARKDGYKVVALRWDAEGHITEQDFLAGFLREADQDVIGRPVDVAEGPDGAIYVSDDYAGSIYRVAWGEAPSVAPEAPEASAPARGPSKGAVALAAIDPSEREAQRERGRALFARNQCGTCHIPEQAPLGMVSRPLEHLAPRYDLNDLSAYLRAPKPPMPVFPLTPEELRDLAVHLLSAYP